MEVPVLVVVAFVAILTPILFSNRVWVWLGFKEAKEYTEQSSSIFFVASAMQADD